MKHVRHEHAGFRGGEIRNRGIRAGAGKYCVFIDGHFLARAHFIARQHAWRSRDGGGARQPHPAGA